jgi:hypothetical protein
MNDAAPLCPHGGDDPVEVITLAAPDGTMATYPRCLTCGFQTLRLRDEDGVDITDSMPVLAREYSTWAEWDAG